MTALPLTSPACPHSTSLVSVGTMIRVACLMTAVCSSNIQADDVPALAPLPKATRPDAAQAAIGRQLFFDPRLSGDATISCATCHNPEHGWADGQALSRGYPGSKYFRNTPTVLNAVHGTLLYWDGRLPASDVPTVVRDHISEAHFFQADGRLIIERLRQVPVDLAELRVVPGSPARKRARADSRKEGRLDKPDILYYAVVAMHAGWTYSLPPAHFLKTSNTSFVMMATVIKNHPTPLLSRKIPRSCGPSRDPRSHGAYRRLPPSRCPCWRGMPPSAAAQPS